MDVVVTGSNGLLGKVLVRELLAHGVLIGRIGEPEAIDRLILVDVEHPKSRRSDARITALAGDIRDRRVAEAAVTRPNTSVFHLASVLSAAAERDFELAVQVNMHGTLNVLETCRSLGGPCRLVFASSIAAYGGSEMPRTVSEKTRNSPESTYGTLKAVCELLANDYARRCFVDSRIARIPTVIIRPDGSQAAASAFASALFREPLAGRDYVIPVGTDVRMPVIGYRTAVAGLIRLHDIDAKQLGTDRVVNLPSVSANVSEMIEALRRVAHARRLGQIHVKPDPAIEDICSTWPSEMLSTRAGELNLPRDDSLDGIVREYMDDFVFNGGRRFPAVH